VYLSRWVVLKLKVLSGVHYKAVQNIKSLVCKASVLKFCDITQEVTVESDASLSELGPTQLQRDQPVAFASRALKPVEGLIDAQIEKESVVFACEKFDAYLFGRDIVQVKTNHQPLETNLRKSSVLSPSDSSGCYYGFTVTTLM